MAPVQVVNSVQNDVFVEDVKTVKYKLDKLGKCVSCFCKIIFVISLVATVLNLGFALYLIVTDGAKIRRHSKGADVDALIEKIITHKLLGVAFWAIIGCMARAGVRAGKKKTPKATKRSLRRFAFLFVILAIVFVLKMSHGRSLMREMKELKFDGERHPFRRQNGFREGHPKKHGPRSGPLAEFPGQEQGPFPTPEFEETLKSVRVGPQMVEESQSKPRHHGGRHGQNRPRPEHEMPPMPEEEEFYFDEPMMGAGNHDQMAAEFNQFPEDLEWLEEDEDDMENPEDEIMELDEEDSSPWRREGGKKHHKGKGGKNHHKGGKGHKGGKDHRGGKKDHRGRRHGGKRHGGRHQEGGRKRHCFIGVAVAIAAIFFCCCCGLFGALCKLNRLSSRYEALKNVQRSNAGVMVQPNIQFVPEPTIIPGQAVSVIQEPAKVHQEEVQQPKMEVPQPTVQAPVQTPAQPQYMAVNNPAYMPVQYVVPQYMQGAGYSIVQGSNLD